MLANTPALVNFASGELSPSVWGRTDRPFYQTGAEILQNFLPSWTGGVSFRTGSKYVHHTRLNKKAFLIPFQFNDEQAYVLEFTDLKMRVYKDGGVVVEATKTITGVSKAAEAVVTSNSHGYSNGDEVYIDGVVGMTQVNGKFFIVSDQAANTFKLKDVDGNYIDSSAYTAYSSGGTAARVYEVTSPYAEADLWQLKYAQTADVMYIAHPFYEPRKLTRTDHDAWTLATYTRTNDVFRIPKTITGVTQANPGVVTSATHGLLTGDRVYISGVVGMTQLNGSSYYVVRIDANTFSLKTLAGVAVDTTAYTAYSSGGTAILETYPGAVGFYGGRLFFGGADTDPDTFWGSRGPNSTTGAPQYDDFTTGTTANDAVTFTITSQNGTADRIRWFSGNPKFLIIGTFGGVYKANGGSDGAAITPSAIAVAPIESYGCADINPVYVGQQTVYIEKGRRTLRSFAFDWTADSYSAQDKNLLAEDITYGGLTQIAFTGGRPDIIWGVRGDGVLLSCTFLSKEDVAGWARHQFGGGGVVFSVAPEFRDNNFDRLWVCVERTIDGVTRRYMEYLSDDPFIKDPVDYYTGVEATDKAVYRNLTFESQKEYVRLDSALIASGEQTVGLTLSALTGSITVTAASSLFDAGDVGKYIFIKYATGLETGVARITAYTSATEVDAEVLQDFHSTSISSWYLTVQTLSGLDHLEGETVGIITDGGVHSDETVSGGSVTLDYPVRYAIVGLKYTGILRTLDLAASAGVGDAYGRPKNIHRIVAMLRNTMGGKYGSSERALYNLQSMAYRKAGSDYLDRAPLLFTGKKVLTNFDTWAEEKRILFVQDEALPMTVLGLIPFSDTAVE